MTEESRTPESPDVITSDTDIMSEYEAMFEHRYTDQDVDYKKTLDTPLPNPPCVENWYHRPKRNFDYTRGQGRGRGRGHRDNDHRGRDGWNRDRDRGWGEGHRSEGHHGSNRTSYAGRREESSYGRSDRHHPYGQQGGDRDRRGGYGGRRDHWQQR